MGLTLKQRKSKQVKEEIHELLSRNGLENSLVLVSGAYRRPFLLFSNELSLQIKTIEIWRHPDTLLDIIKRGIVVIHDIKDNMKFESFEEYRKHILIKKLSGLEK